jgi:hypothetical protein
VAAAALLALLCDTGAASAASTCIESAPILTVSWPSEPTAVTCRHNIFMLRVYTCKAYMTTQNKEENGYKGGGKTKKGRAKKVTTSCLPVCDYAAMTRPGTLANPTRCQPQRVDSKKQSHLMFSVCHLPLMYRLEDKDQTSKTGKHKTKQ